MIVSETTETLYSEPEVDEHELIRRVSAGDEQAFAIFVSRFSSMVFRFLKRMVFTEEDAEDLTQETFCSIYKHRSSLNPNKDIRPYLFTAAKRKAISLIRWRSVRSMVTPLTSIHEEILESKQVSAFESIRHQQQERAVNQALRSIHPTKRAVLILRFFEGLTYPEISQIMNKPEGTIKSIAFRAEKELRAKLAPMIESW